MSPTKIPLVSLYREILTAALGPDPADPRLGPIADPVLALFPAIMEDPDAAYALLELWGAQSPKLGAAPRKEELAFLFRSCVLHTWPLLHMACMPPVGMSNDAAGVRKRTAMASRFAQTHPVETLSRVAAEWEHRPLSVGETAFRYADSLPPFA